MKLYIKNMVCDRCKMAVKAELDKLGLETIHIELGNVTISESLDKKQLSAVDEALKPLGFELIDDKRKQLITQIKSQIIHLIYKENNQLKSNLSDYLTQHLQLDYHQLSHLFSEVDGITIEKYYINQKIERVKELLVYDELNLSEITHLLNYSSTAHLSAQFKKVTGFTPSYFKKLKENKRIALDKL